MFLIGFGFGLIIGAGVAFVLTALLSANGDDIEDDGWDMK